MPNVFRIWGGVCLALAAVSCVPVPREEPVTPLPLIAPRETPEQMLRREFLAAYDAVAPSQKLAGRLVVIDPGHFAASPGVVAAAGLREMDVNLAVAHHLAGLLRQQGAAVVLTREGARTAVPVDSEGRPAVGDLQWRADLVNGLSPDLFISVHHNSRADTTYNATEIYYDFPMLSTNRAKDFADRLAPRFEKWLAHPVALHPANYFVLRNTRAPAILGEASYLSRAETAEEYSRLDRIMREAFAYYEAAMSWFAVERPALENVEVGARNADFNVAFRMAPTRDGTGHARLAIRPEGIHREFSLEFSRADSSNFIAFRLDRPLAEGRHELEIEAVDAAGLATAVESVEFFVSGPPPPDVSPLVVVRVAPGSDPAMAEWLGARFVEIANEGGRAWRLRVLPPALAASDTLTLRETITGQPALFIDLLAERASSPHLRAAIGHYPGSKAGAEIAASFSEALGKASGTDDISTGEDIYYLTIQTGMPAVRVRLSGESGHARFKQVPGLIVEALDRRFSGATAR